MKGAHPFQNPRSNPTFHSPAQHPSVSLLLPSMSANDGGEGGIRTHGPVARTAVFETARFGHSRTSPRSHPPTPGAITPAHPGSAKMDPFPVACWTREQGINRE